jgi:hypothetical protein
MNNNSTSTFWELASLKITIPIIQRDYAQGREEEYDKREKFLDKLKDHLDIKNKPLNLDFVYGRKKDSSFYPIDGQQRLTTLYLLHWYLSLKENIGKEDREKLLNFTYDTRISSREFCHYLIKKNIEIPITTGDDVLIKNITDSHWYRANWEYDSTISAMLIMIQAIHDKFYNSQSGLWDRLCKNRLISFQLLDLGAEGFELTDELYIKMNARGKQLTSFENFKANFIQFIDSRYPTQLIEHKVRGTISYAEYFAFNIEKEWTDLFWDNRGDEEIIDNHFGNYFEVISQLLFFKKNVNAMAEDFNSGFSSFNKIYEDEENLLFLFKSLDKLYEIHCLKSKDSIGDFFNSIFTYRGNSINISGKINLFGDSKKGSNLFRSILKQGQREDARNQILFYSILFYLIKFDDATVSNGLFSYCRLIRNLLQAVRQRNDVKYNTNVRINNFGSYWKVLEQLATKNPNETLVKNNVNLKGSQLSEVSLKNEKIKAEVFCEDPKKLETIIALEELPFFGGLIHQLSPKENKDKLNGFYSVLNNIWNSNHKDYLKIQSLLIYGFEGIYIKNSKMGELYYFGEQDNWDIVLTSNDETTSTALVKLLSDLSKYSIKEIVSKIKVEIKAYMEKRSERDWKYYFAKYPAIFSQNNYFVWSKNEFEIRLLGGTSSNPLISYHINPYVLAVSKMTDNLELVDYKDCRQQYSGYSPLVTKNQIEMKPTYEGWEIRIDPERITNDIIDKYNLVENNDIYLLKEAAGKDRVEIAFDFIQNLN